MVKTGFYWQGVERERRRLGLELERQESIMDQSTLHQRLEAAIENQMVGYEANGYHGEIFRASLLSREGQTVYTTEIKREEENGNRGAWQWDKNYPGVSAFGEGPWLLNLTTPENTERSVEFFPFGEPEAAREGRKEAAGASA
jgi:hypothetical protein